MRTDVSRPCENRHAVHSARPRGVVGGSHRVISDREREPEEDVLERIGVEDPCRSAEPERPRRPAEENASRAIGRLVERAVDCRIAEQRIERQLCVELPVVAEGWMMPVVGNSLQVLRARSFRARRKRIIAVKP